MFYVIIAVCFLASIRLVRDGAEPIMFKEHDPVVRQYKYQYEAQKQEIKESYEKSDLPKSGYMLTEEYEELSKGVSRNDLYIEDAVPYKKSNMKYVPQPTYKLIRYNNPPGSPELNLPRKVNFDRQINAQGIVSGDFTMLVYPTVYYYADANCTSCAVFVIPLDTKLSKLERVKKANVAKKIDRPLFETDKDITTEGAYRTITPVDFSEDNRYIIAKEKIGYVHDGIWRTNLWIHDFETKRSWELPEVRAAIINYWHNRTGVDLAENRWDIYPLGFDKTNQEKVLVCGYAYTGDIPAFLGTWSVDLTGNRCELVDLEGKKYNVSTVGFKMVVDSYESRDFVEWEANRQEKIEKQRKEDYEKQRKAMKKSHKREYKRQLKQLKAEYRLKLREYRKSKRRGTTSKGDEQKFDVDVNNIDNGQDIDYQKFNQEREELIKKQEEELKAKQKKHKTGTKTKTKTPADSTEAAPEETPEVPETPADNSTETAPEETQ
ncbi:MAG: hypothetical protein LUB59_06125 [Candidatus Gastranaerophilales bacterium]|nr:hypothetical protein [Candidatus Gastranaerophilales bacterium]